jgi:CheY-like chemotaxis protein
LELINSVYEFGYRYSFIFTDFSMPEMDGVEFVKLVRKMLTDKFGIPLEK